MTNILKRVDVADLIKISVYCPNVLRPGEFTVDLQAVEFGKRVVVDDGALKTLNKVLVEKCRQFKSAKDPRVLKYIEEFVARMCSEWHRNGLLVIEDIPDEPEDPYKTERKKGEQYVRRS